MHQDFRLEPFNCNHCLPYFGDERRWESRLILFIMFRLNPVLLAKVPIRLDVIMANTGWDPAQAEYKEKNRDLIQKMNWQEREKVVAEEHEREVIHTHQRTHGEADCKYLKTLTCATIRRHQEAKKWDILTAEKHGSRHRQMSQVRRVESCCKDRHRSSHRQTPPAEKTLTKAMPQRPVPMSLVRLHHDRTISERETIGPKRGSEAEPPPPAAKDRPEKIPTLELRSEDEDNPLDWDKYLAQLARMESLQCLAPLPDMPKSRPESRAGTIADTLEAESEPAEAHELTGEGTTDATNPTTSNRFPEGDEEVCAISWEELEEMYRGVPTCRDDRHEGILPSAAPEHHPVPSPPDAILDKLGAGTGTMPDAPMVSSLEAMLDEPEAGAGTVPKASPAMELRLLQSLEQEQATSRRHTLSATQAEHSPQQAKSSPPPSDASSPGPTYSSSETPPLPGPGTGYSSTSLSEEAGEGNNTAGEDTPAKVDDTTIEADSTGVTVTEPNNGASPMETE